MTLSNLFTKPWFIGSIVFCCFAIITPKILLPLFKQIFGLNEPPSSNSVHNSFERRNPQSVMHKSAGNIPLQSRGPPQQQQQEQTSTSSTRSILVFILPIYAIGIAIYMIYTLFKVYGNNKKDENKNNIDSDLDADDGGLSNIKWDSINKRFTTINDQSTGVGRGDDEYSNLDEDYVKFLKNKRRNELNDKKSQNNNDSDLNNVLNVMKNSLSNINNKLVDAEKKGGPMDDTDLQSLRLQLANTELQMIKILQTIDSMVVVNKNDNESIIQNNSKSSSKITSSIDSDDDSSDDLKENKRRKNRKLNKIKLLKHKKKLSNSSSLSSSQSSSTDIDKWPLKSKNHKISLSDSNNEI
jgi:hypothetical protein